VPATAAATHDSTPPRAMSSYRWLSATGRARRAEHTECEAGRVERHLRRERRPMAAVTPADPAGRITRGNAERAGPAGSRDRTEPPNATNVRGHADRARSIDTTRVANPCSGSRWRGGPRRVLDRQPQRLRHAGGDFARRARSTSRRRLPRRVVGIQVARTSVGVGHGGSSAAEGPVSRTGRAAERTALSGPTAMTPIFARAGSRPPRAGSRPRSIAGCSSAATLAAATFTRCKLEAVVVYGRPFFEQRPSLAVVRPWSERVRGSRGTVS